MRAIWCPEPRPTTTASTIPAGQTPVTIVSGYPAALNVKINGTNRRVTPGQTLGPFGVTPSPDGNDAIEISRVDDATCGLGNARGYFQDGGPHRINITAGSPNGCAGGQPSPRATVEPGGQSV